MFSLGKAKENSTLLDSTLVDHSKKIVFGVGALLTVVLIVVISEIYTSSKLSSQKLWITKGKNSQEQANKLVIDLAKINSVVKEGEYQHLKILNSIMSPAEFQNFKNSISGISFKNNITINSLKEGKPLNMKDYSINSINFTAISNYTNYVNFKKDLTNIKFKINFEEETIVREKPTSKNIIITAVISALVSEKKENLFIKKKKFYDKMKKKELGPKNKKKIKIDKGTVEIDLDKASQLPESVRSRLRESMR